MTKTDRKTRVRDAGAALLLAAALAAVAGAPRSGAAPFDGSSSGSATPSGSTTPGGSATPVMTDSMARAIEGGQPIIESPPPSSETAPPSETPPPPLETAPPRAESAPGAEARPPLDVPPGRFVAEVLDSTYFIEPAEFFALDLPMHAQNGAAALHILGDVNVVGGRHDIIVRLFRTGDYQNWLKRRGGRQAGPIWSSPRQRHVHLDQELPQGSPLVLLLDNGYSLRTPKRVRVQVQLQYQGSGGGSNLSAQSAPPPQEGDITPRSNNDDEFTPPPPPPPSEGK